MTDVYAVLRFSVYHKRTCTQMPCRKPGWLNKVKKNFFFFKSFMVPPYRWAGGVFFSFPISYSISSCETLPVHAYEPSTRGYRAETTHLHGGGTSITVRCSWLLSVGCGRALLIFSGKFSTHFCTPWSIGYAPNERNRHRTRT